MLVIVICVELALANYLKFNIPSDPKTSFIKGKNRGPEMSILKAFPDLLFGFYD